MALNVPQDTGLPIMVIKHTPFCPELILDPFPNPWVILQKNAIFRIFIQISFPVRVKRFSVFLIKWVMQITCKLKSAEKKLIQETFML